MKDLLSTRLVIWIGVPVTLLFGLVIWVGSIRGAERVRAQTEANARAVARLYAERLESRLASAARIPEMHARVLESGTFTSEPALESYLRSVVEKNPAIYGSCLAFEPHTFSAEKFYYAPYLFRNDQGALEFVQLGNPEYNPFKWDWYRLPKETGEPLWTEPYFDDGGGNTIMSTYSVPFFRDGAVWGVATIDIAMTQLIAETSHLPLDDDGYLFLVSKQGRFLTFPDKTKIMRGSIQEENSALAGPMLRGKDGFVRTIDPLRKEDAWVAFVPVVSGGFSLAVVHPQSAVMAEAWRQRWEMLGLGAFGVVALFAAITFLARSISRPITQLSAVAKEVAAGDFSQRIDTKGATSEVRNLGQAFNKMTRDLQMRMQELRYTTTMKERLEGELSGARSLQMGLLPRDFPKGLEFELHAMVKPAREVGGDFYDFYRIDDDRLAIVLGDVSGKGIPAALFMAVTKTLLKASSSPQRSLSDTVAKANNELCLEADAGMFVTLLYAILNTATGELEFCNAGHMAPLLLDETGHITSLDAPPFPALGVLQNLPYTSARVMLTPGHTLFLFTDGVTEALNSSRTFYTTARLLIVLRDVHALPIERVTQSVVQDVRAFSADREQSDDISVLALRWLGPRNAHLPARAHPQLAESVSLS